MAKVKALNVKALVRCCDPGRFSFSTTSELDGSSGIVGQERAEDAVRFGLGIQREGYNLFVLGSPGSGRESLVRAHLERLAKEKPIPPDLCYVHDFDNEHQPLLLTLPAGKGRKLKEDMKALIDDLRYGVSTAFERAEVQRKRLSIEQSFKEKPESKIEVLRNKAKKKSITIMETPMGLAIVPMKDGEMMPSDEFEKLPKRKRNQFDKNIEVVQQELQEILHEVPRWNRLRKEALEKLEEEVTLEAVEPFFEKLRKRYARYPRVSEYLRAVENDVVKHASEFIENDEDAHPMLAFAAQSTQQTTGHRFEVNVIVDHSDAKTAPVIFESHPTHQNLMGRIEHMAQMGALTTSFHLIRAGALHRANGGYLVLDARRVLLQPQSWDSLKRALNSGKVNIESLGQALGLISAVSLEPEPLPLDVKIVLIGTRLLYYMLCHYDPDFHELFKVEVDFEDDMERTDESELEYAEVLAALVQKSELRSFDRKAIARIIDYAARLTGHAGKLTLHFRQIEDLMLESDYWARESRHNIVREADVAKALEQRERRADRIRKRILEQIMRGTVAIDSEGERVGQINALAVVQVGKTRFGRVSKISSQVWLGRAGVLDIERKVDLGGPLHTKGILILSSYIKSTYGSERPLAISASLVFEQSYGGIDGDSASFAECCVLLSAISEVPLRQDLAVTGSINQHGGVQAIGGANEKIEGFFDLCDARGLTGTQGVIIPKSNVPHLMLRRDVVEAVKRGEFHIYPIEHVEEGLQLLTGLTPGKRNKNGNFAKNTMHGHVEIKLKDMFDKVKQASKAPKSQKTAKK